MEIKSYNILFVLQLVQMSLIHAAVITTWQIRGGTQDAIFMCYKSTLPWHPKFTGQHGVGKGGFYSPGRWDFAIVQNEGNLHNIQVIVIIIKHLSMKQLILQ